MADRGRIEDFDELESWLEGKDVRVSHSIAARSALRALPEAMAVVERTFEPFRGDRFLLACLRAALTSGAVSTGPRNDVELVQSARYAAGSAAAAAAAAVRSAAARSATAAHYAAESATESSRFAAESATESARFASAAARSAAARSAVTLSAADSAVLHDVSLLLDAKPFEIFDQTLWPRDPAVQELLTPWETFAERDDPDRTWEFWRRWYQSMLEGNPMDWDLQLQVALIDNDVWKDGPQAVAEAIRDIEAGVTSLAVETEETGHITSQQLASVGNAATQNSHVIVITGAGVIAQVQDFRETVRGRNDLEPELRDDLFELLDSFVAKLEALLSQLPCDGQSVGKNQARALLLWWRDYSRMLKTKAAKFVSADNLSEVTLPTGIILGSTAIGGLIGQPLAGSVVGGLIVNQIKPGQAAKEFLKPSSPENSGSN